MARKIAIITAGGDCPGLNAAIRGVGKAAILKYGWDVCGFASGYLGLIHDEYIELNERSLSGILTQGGTILGTSREKPFKSDDELTADDKVESIKTNLKKHGIDVLVAMGGNGTMKTALKLQQAGINVIGVPKTIDNDIWGTDISFGFDSAVNIASEAIDRLHSTANSHRRIMVVEVMGHKAGWLTLHAGVASGGDVILIPEIPYDLDIISNYVLKRAKEGKPYSIVVVAEGIHVPPKKTGKARNVPAGAFIAHQINKRSGLETRETILGYIQRGGSPSPRDRIIAGELGTYSASLIAKDKYGTMAAYQKGELTSIDLTEVAGRLKTVPLDHSIVENTRALDTCFGDL